MGLRGKVYGKGCGGKGDRVDVYRKIFWNTRPAFPTSGNKDFGGLVGAGAGEGLGLRVWAKKALTLTLIPRTLNKPSDPTSLSSPPGNP